MLLLPGVRRSDSVVSVVQLSRVQLSVTLWTAATRLLCPPLSPKVCSNSCPLCQWCYLTISFSVIPFSSSPQSFPASESFPMSQLFTSGGQKYWSFRFSISPSNEYSGLISFRVDWFDLAVQGTLKSLLQHHKCTFTYSFSDSFPIKFIIEYWVEFPMLYSRILLIIYFMCICCVYVNPNFLIYPSPPHFPFGNHKFVF